MSKRLPNISTLSDRQLWNLVLRPFENNMPEKIKRYLKKAEKEFHKRKIKLNSIMEINYVFK